jgi:V-type H+-transporting ATPase subunit C
MVAQYGRLGGIHGQTSKNENQEELLDHELQSVNDSSYRPYVQFELDFEYERR